MMTNRSIFGWLTCNSYLCEDNVYADEYYSLGETVNFEIPKAVPLEPTAISYS